MPTNPPVSNSPITIAIAFAFALSHTRHHQYRHDHDHGHGLPMVGRCAPARPADPADSTQARVRPAAAGRLVPRPHCTTATATVTTTTTTTTTTITTTGHEEKPACRGESPLANRRAACRGKPPARCPCARRRVH
eukprot:gene11285-biopygen18385